MSDGGKGSTQRPTDYEKFGSNFDAIFRGKKMIETINTYESRPSPERGQLIEKYRKIYRCTKCTKIFNTKEEAELHKHPQSGEGDK